MPKSPNEFSSDQLSLELRYDLGKIKWEDPAVIRKLKAIACQQKSLESIVSEYRELIEAIKRQISDPAMIAVVLQEIRKDMRVSEMRKKSYYSPSHSVLHRDTPSSSSIKYSIQSPLYTLSKDQTARLIAALVNSLRNS